MKLKEYLKILEKLYPADSDDPNVIVQQLACLAAMQLSKKKSLPMAVGLFEEMDMDIINAGILAGLEKLHVHDGDMNTLRAYLYPRIAGEMFTYAWKRENRVTDSVYRGAEVYAVEAFDSETTPEGYFYKAMPEAPDQLLIDSPEAMQLEEDNLTEFKQYLKLLHEHMEKEDVSLLLQDMEYNGTRAKKQRIAWAESLGVSVNALRMRLMRIRREARDVIRSIVV